MDVPIRTLVRVFRMVFKKSSDELFATLNLRSSHIIEISFGFNKLLKFSWSVDSSKKAQQRSGEKSFHDSDDDWESTAWSSCWEKRLTMASRQSFACNEQIINCKERCWAAKVLSDNSDLANEVPFSLVDCDTLRADSERERRPDIFFKIWLCFLNIYLVQ